MAVDKDDEKLHQYCIDKIKQEYPSLSITFHEVERSINFVTDYWNVIAKMAVGRWIMAINDDSLFLTKGWDVIIDKKMSKQANKMGDDIIYGKVDDRCNLGGRNSKDCYFSCWCLQGKEVQQALGFFYDPNVYVCGVDQICGLIFLALEKLNNQPRIVNIYEVEIDHISHHTGLNKPEEDPNWHYMMEIEKNHGYETTREKEMEYAIKINNYIIKKKDSK